MSWRGRDEGRYSNRWGGDDRHENRSRSPVVWEPRDSPDRRHESPARDRYRDRHDRKERHNRDQDRYGRCRSRDRYDRSRDRDRERDRERDRDRRRTPPRRFSDHEDIPSAPSPPRISRDGSKDKEDSRSIHHSNGRERSLERVELHDPKPMYEAQSSYESKMEPKDIPDMDQVINASPGDWYCKCGSYNFKRRNICYRRKCYGKRSDGIIYGGEGLENNSGITKRLLFRRLDALTTEETILNAIKDVCSKELLDSIAGITIGRETLTGASKCLAYINFNSIADSTAAYTALKAISMTSPLVIDNREVMISYYNEPAKPQKNLNSVDYAAYYAQAAAYATNSQAMSEADRVNAAAAVAQSAISAAQARNLSWTPVAAPTFASTTPVATATNIPTGDGKTTYAAPDTRTFMYDETSGYYYDPSTGLYYDGTTQYFFNNQLNQYMYWDATSSTYVSATQTQQNTDQPKLPSPPEATVENTIVSKDPPEEKKKKDKEDKVKVAKKIAKDMERWARTLNQRKENAKSNIVMEQPLDMGASKGSADIGFSVLGAGPSLSHTVREREPSPPPNTEEFLMKKVAEQPVFESDEGIIDWAKLTCLLCKRRFPSPEVLNKHKMLSDLHKQNLAEYQKKNDLLPQTNGYRDRAAERRMKFGEDEAPIRKRYDPQESALLPTLSHPPPSVVDTIGGKMLQKMGWSQGRGLGKEEQGRIAPIEAEQRQSLAGLGQRRGIYTPTPGETYRDTVKKLMIARYKEVVGQEDET